MTRQSSPHDSQEQVQAQGLDTQTILLKFDVDLTSPYCSHPPQLAGSQYTAKFGLSKLTGLSVVWIIG